MKNIQRKKQQAASFIIWYSTVPAFFCSYTVLRARIIFLKKVHPAKRARAQELYIVSSYTYAFDDTFTCVWMRMAGGTFIRWIYPDNLPPPPPGYSNDRNVLQACLSLAGEPGPDWAILGAEMGKHPDLMVGPPTPTIFPTIGRNFEIS